MSPSRALGELRLAAAPAAADWAASAHGTAEAAHQIRHLGPGASDSAEQLNRLVAQFKVSD